MATSARKKTLKVNKKKAFVGHVCRRHASAFVTISVIVGVSAMLVTLLGPVQIYKLVMDRQREAPVQKLEEQLQVVVEVPSEGKFKVSNHQVPQEDEANLKTIPSTQSSEDLLIEWALTHGAKLNGIEFVVHDASASHRGIHSSKALQPGEVILTIGENLLITGEKARASIIGQQLQHYFPDEFDQTYIALFLIEQRLLGKESWWYPYIQMLPKSFSNIPVNFGKAELDMLVGSSVIPMYERSLEALHHRYDSFCEKLPEFSEKFSFELLKWATQAVYSRVFGIIINGEEATAMIPIVDFLNHAADYDTTWTYDDEKGVVRLMPLKSIPLASEVCNSYGQKGNEELLSTYGFALPNNEFNEAVIYLALQTDDPLLQKKISLMETPDADRLRFSLSASSNHPSFQAALKMCRLVVATEEDLQLLSKGSSTSTPFSEANERQALLLFQKAGEESLSKFPQSSEFDEELLKSNNLTSNERNIILTRLGEKKVLLWMIDFVDQVLPLIGMKDVSQFNRIRLLPENKQANSYLQSVKNIYLLPALTQKL